MSALRRNQCPEWAGISVRYRQEYAIDIDPLNKALSITSSSFEWFTKEEQKKWKEVFLSRYTGSDLVEKLINENEEQI